MTTPTSSMAGHSSPRKCYTETRVVLTTRSLCEEALSPSDGQWEANREVCLVCTGASKYIKTNQLMLSFSSIRLLLTNTLVPRDTKTLVAGVAQRRADTPEIIDPALESIQQISDRAVGLLGGAVDVDRQKLISSLEVSEYSMNSADFRRT